jgi:hypothetical protein
MSPAILQSKVVVTRFIARSRVSVTDENRKVRSWEVWQHWESAKWAAAFGQVHHCLFYLLLGQLSYSVFIKEILCTTSVGSSTVNE